MNRTTSYIKSIIFFSVILLLGYDLKAQNIPAQNLTPVIEMSAEYPGGNQLFVQYVSKSLKYREVEHLLGVNGKVRVSFVVDSTGKLTDIIPQSNIGSGCEEEVADIISRSRPWKPAMQNGRAIKQKIVIPITFNVAKDIVNMGELRKGNDGYLFQIKEAVYDIDHAAAILGETFSPGQIEITTAYTGDKKPEGKSNVWLVKIKS